VPTAEITPVLSCYGVRSTKMGRDDTSLLCLHGAGVWVTTRFFDRAHCPSSLYLYICTLFVCTSTRMPQWTTNTDSLKLCTWSLVLAPSCSLAPSSSAGLRWCSGRAVYPPTALPTSSAGPSNPSSHRVTYAQPHPPTKHLGFPSDSPGSRLQRAGPDLASVHLSSAAGPPHRRRERVEAHAPL